MRSDKLYRIKMPLVSCYAIRGRRTVLIDSLVPGQEGRILNRLLRLGVEPWDISLILLTHFHIDHLGSIPALRARLQAPVAVHAADAPYVSGEAELPPLKAVTPDGAERLKQMATTPMPPRVTIKPDIVFDDGMDLASYGVRARVIHTPGHTAGSVSVLLDGGPAVVGDLIMGEMARPHKLALPRFAEDVAQVKRSVAAVLAQKPTRIYCAHGGRYSIEDVKARFPG
jgi:hydroxyacylglutathione hydrolase